MLMPIPVIIPATTEYGVYETKRPARVNASITCIAPASMTMVNTSVRLSAWLTTTTAASTDTGAEGPKIMVRVPQNSTPLKPAARAPYSPARGPRPEATP